MATIKDVAKLAGVSMGTVSNVLNGKTNNLELIERVESAMKQLAYRPDANARSLKNTKTKMIGVIVPDMNQQNCRDFLMGLEDLLRVNGYSMIVRFSRNNHLIEKKSIESFAMMRVDGIVLYSFLPPKWDEELERLEIPTVMISHYDQYVPFADNLVLNYAMAFKKMLGQLFEKKKEMWHLS